MGNGDKGQAAAEVLRFLGEHQLEPTPEHYAFAWRYLAGSDEALSAEVARLIDGGVRLTERDVVRLSSPAGGIEAANDDLAPELERISLDMLAILTAASSEATVLGQELTSAAVDLVQGRQASIKAAIDRTMAHCDEARLRLDAMSRQTRRLYADLRAVQHDADRDAGTGALSRSSIEELLADALALQPERVVAAVIDLDGVNRLRASHGQAVAVQVLHALVATVSRHCYPAPVGRIGAYRLLVVFDDSDTEEAADMLGRARDAFTAREMKVRENDAAIGSVSFSAGVDRARSRETPALVAALTALVEGAARGGGDTIIVEQPIIGL